MGNRRRHIQGRRGVVSLCAVFVVLFVVAAGKCGLAETFTHTFQPGWQLVSFPFDPSDRNVSSLGISTPNVYSFDPATQKFVSSDENLQLEPAKGYWLWLGGAKTVSLSGTADSRASFSFQLVKGWNLISVPSTLTFDWNDNVTVDGQPLSKAATKLSGPLEYSEATGTAYVKSDKLEAWKAYWIEADAACALNVSNLCLSNNNCSTDAPFCKDGGTAMAKCVQCLDTGACGQNADCQGNACACVTGHANCNSSFGDGCEVQTDSDADNCGACGNKCAAGSTCTAGKCADSACAGTDLWLATWLPAESVTRNAQNEVESIVCRYDTCALKTTQSVDISKLACLPKLKTIDLYGQTTVTGGLASVTGLSSLENLSLSYTQVSGDISSLSNLSALKLIGLSYTNASGNLSSLATMTNLTVIGLSGTFVTGDLLSLSQLSDLTVLYLYYDNVTGSLSSLSGMTKMQELELGTTYVSGSLSSLSALSKLELLDLSYTTASGDISTLSTMSSLAYLGLGYTTVSGNLSVLSGLTKLTTLGLSGTSVSGNTSSLGALTSLTDLYLYSTQVSGDVSSLARLTKLNYLYLGLSKVSGSIDSLAPLTGLVELDLTSDSVSASSAGSISPLVKLTQLYISGTLITQEQATQIKAALPNCTVTY